MSTHSSQDFELDDLEESDLKNLSEDLYLDDVGEWREGVDSYGSESDNDEFLTRGQNSRTSKQQSRFRGGSRGRSIGLKRGANRFPHRGRGRATGKRGFSDPTQRQFNNEKAMNFREDGWRRKSSQRKSESYSQEDEPVPGTRRSKEYDAKRREGRFATNRNSGNENQSLQSTVREDTCKNTLFDTVNTFSGSKCNEIQGLEVMETYSDEKNKKQYGQENQREQNKRQEHSPEPLRSSYSDKMSLSPSNSNKRRSLERTGSSSSYYNSENRTSRRNRSEYDSRRHKSRSPSPRSPRSDDINRDRSPKNQPYSDSRRNTLSPERYYRRSDSSRRSVSVSPERNKIPSPPANPGSKKEWYPEVQSSYVNQPPSSDYQSPSQILNIPPAYSGPGQYSDTSAVPMSYSGSDYRNYTDYHNPSSYPRYDVGNANGTYFHQPPPGTATMQSYMPQANPQAYTRTDMCQQDVSWLAYGNQNQSQPPGTMPMGGCSTSESFQNASSMSESIENKKKKAIEDELKQQRRSLAKQREEYYSKSRTLRKELELLQNQKRELVAEKLQENEKILKENQKLQTEIQNKLKAIANVTEMLSTIIGDDTGLIEELEDEKKAEEASKLQKKCAEKNSPAYDREIRNVPSPPLISTHEQKNKHNFSEPYKHEEHNVQESSQGLSSASGETNNESVKTYNYVHYDPEMHWCRVCNIFPKTAKEYLNHLHTAEHKAKTLEKNLVDMPWHKNQIVEETPYYEGAPVKRLPIRGLQFFISATAWYCKLCSVWIGDLHCASVHLKSTIHSENYSGLIQQKPHWEVDWLADRTRAYEKAAENHQNQSENSASANRLLTFKDGSGKDPNEDAVEITKSLSDQLMAVFKEKNKSKLRSKRRRNKSSDSSSSDSSSSSSSSSSDRSSDRKEEKTLDRAHSIRVTMRNKDIPPIKGGGKLDSYDRKKYSSSDKEVYRESRKSSADDRILHEWMEFSSIDKDRDMVNNLKDRLKRKQATDHEDVKKPYEKRRSSREEYRRYDERPIRDDHRKYDDRKKSYDDGRKRYSGKYDFDERHGNKRNEKSPDRRSDKCKNEKVYSKTDGNKGDHKRPELDEKNVTKSGTSSSTEKQHSKNVQDDNDSDNNESSLEKLTAESAAKKKDVKKRSVQPFKCKLPFIGRMPFIGKIPAIKKKSEGDNVSKENKQRSKSGSPKQCLVWPEIPRFDESVSAEIENSIAVSTAETGTSHSKDTTKPSGKTINFSPSVSSSTSTSAVNSVTKNVTSTVTAPVVATTNTATVSVSSDNSNTIATTNKNNGAKEQTLPRSTLVLSKNPGVTAKTAALLKKKKMFDDGIAGGVEDMDIEVEDNDELSEENLPKDFQDALDILFPTETPPGDNSSVENQTLTNVNSSTQNNSAMNVAQHQSNIIQNADVVNNPVNSEPGQRNMLPIGHMPGLVHQYGMNNAPPMGGPGHINTNNLSSSGHLKPPLLGPHERQMGPELEGPSGRQMNCRPDFNMMPNRMGQCLMGPGPPDHGLHHLNDQQMGGPEMMMPQGGGIMGPGHPSGPVTMVPPGPPPDSMSVGMMPPFGDEPGGIDADCSHSGSFVFKRKNPPSQKKRQQLKKRRDMLEAREKELNEKIAELQGKVGSEENPKDAQSNTNSKKDDSKRMELALLGIDEDDICCK